MHPFIRIKIHNLFFIYNLKPAKFLELLQTLNFRLHFVNSGKKILI